MPLLLTGAAGALGRYLRPRLIEKYGQLRSTDIVDPAPAHAGEELTMCDLADFDALGRIVRGCSAIVHFGAYATEAAWDTILNSNIVGTYNVYEAARRHGVRRIVFASSNHAIGFHPISRMLDADSVQRPDTYYGVSKAFGEDLGSLYVDKYDLEIACLRIGSCTPMPREPRHLSTWLSYPDLFRLVSACLDAPKLEFTVMYGASKNARTWWDNAKNPHVKYEPQDNAEDYAAQILSHGDPRDPKSPEARFHGGPYCADGYVVR